VFRTVADGASSSALKLFLSILGLEQGVPSGVELSTKSW
jgi:hypothetical protein